MGTRRFSAEKAASAVRTNIKYLVLVAGGVVFMFPLYWLVISAFKADKNMFLMPPQLFPDPWDFSHFPRMFRYYDFLKYLRNTLLLVALNLGGVLLTSPLVAYSMARLRWRGRDACFMLILATMMLPSQVTMIPLYITFSNLGFVNTYVPLVIGSWLGGGAFNIFLIKQFFMTIPMDIEESARIDGAGVVLIYSRIMLPLITPVLITVAIFVFMGTWNDFMGPLLYIQKTELMTLSISLRLFQQQVGTMDYGMLFAATILMVVPVIVFFFLGQRKFIDGIALTGMKA